MKLTTDFHVVLKQGMLSYDSWLVQKLISSELITEQYLVWIFTETEFYILKMSQEKSWLSDIYERKSEYQQLICIPATTI